MEAQISIIKELDGVECSELLDIPTNANGGLLEVELVWFKNFHTLHNIIKEKCYYDCRTNDSFMVMDDLLNLAEEINDLLDLAEEIGHEESDIENANKFLAFISMLEENRSYFSNYNFKYYLL